jgi:hypothetical protein
MIRELSYLGLALMLSACNTPVKDEESIPILKEVSFTNTYAYKQSTYTDALKRCVSIRNKDKSCTLEELPLLSPDERVPTKEQIMKRVFVSHTWMGRRFEHILDLLDDDIKILLGSVTAIVIDDDINPSFYWSVTGAIYIEPDYLWLNEEERKTITKNEDYRSKYAEVLNFVRGARFVKSGGGTFAFKNLNSPHRTEKDIVPNVARLLYHELAHANDYIPRSKRYLLDKKLSVYENMLNLYSQSETIGQKLHERYPLYQEKLQEIAGVIWHGKEATEEQKNMSAYEVAELFENDDAVRLYSYSSRREDLATLFENTMLKYHYGIEQEIAFLSKPDMAEKPSCEDYEIALGIGNRIGNDEVKKRAVFIVNKILGKQENLEQIIGKERRLKIGYNWCI